MHTDDDDECGDPWEAERVENLIVDGSDINFEDERWLEVYDRRWFEKKSGDDIDDRIDTIILLFFLLICVWIFMPRVCELWQ